MVSRKTSLGSEKFVLEKSLGIGFGQNSVIPTYLGRMAGWLALEVEVAFPKARLLSLNNQVVLRYLSSVV